MLIGLPVALMGEQYRERYEKHFDKLDICEYDLQHEELLVSYPEKWAEEIRRVTKEGMV